MWRAEIENEILGVFHSSLAEEFWRAVAATSLMNFHVVVHHGKNTHNIIEAIFKASAIALRQATEIDPEEPVSLPQKGHYNFARGLVMSENVNKPR